MPLITLPPDQTGDDIKFVVDTSKAIGDLLSDCITRVVARISPRNSEFFGDARIGTNGVRLLTTLGAHVQFIATHYPEKMNATLMKAGRYLNPHQDGKAGRYLNPHQDGTVTYDPPPTILNDNLSVDYYIGAEVSYEIQADEEGAIEVSELPQGLTFENNLISGKPEIEGDYSIQITATNPFGSSSKVLTIRIIPIQEQEPIPET